MNFEDWYEYNAKYINPNDLYAWLSEAFDAGFNSGKQQRLSENHKTGLLDVIIDEVRQQEREACAKVCDEGAGAYVNSDYTKGLVHGARLCAAAIRARGNK